LKISKRNQTSNFTRSDPFQGLIFEAAYLQKVCRVTCAAVGDKNRGFAIVATYKVSKMAGISKTKFLVRGCAAEGVWLSDRTKGGVFGCGKDESKKEIL